MRFDVVSIVLGPSGPRIEHLPEAFFNTPDGPNRPGRKPGPAVYETLLPDGRSDAPGPVTARCQRRRPQRGRTFTGPPRRRRPNDKRGPGKPARARSTKPTSADDGLVRLNRYLAQSGVASRREADTRSRPVW